MAENTITIGGTICVILECGNCGVWHTVPKAKYDSAYREGGFWTCPNGHQRGWSEGADKREIDQLRRDRDRLKQDAARLEDEIALEKRRAAAAESKYTQARRRAAAGVCPCCSRSFQNVQRHMATKHPNVTPLAIKEAASPKMKKA